MKILMFNIGVKITSLYQEYRRWKDGMGKMGRMNLQVQTEKHPDRSGVNTLPISGCFELMRDLSLRMPLHQRL